MRRRLVLLLLAGCGGAVASEASTTRGNDGGTTAPGTVDAGSAAVPEVTVVAAAVESTVTVAFSTRPEACDFHDGGACTVGTCVEYTLNFTSLGSFCVAGRNRACASLHCAVGTCVSSDDVDNVYSCVPISGCWTNADCGREQPHCVRRDRDGYASFVCAADYASACTYAGCGDKGCIVTESDPVAIRCAP